MAIEQDVAQLMQWMQSVKSNAKETHEFSDIGEVNNQTLIRLAKLGQSYKIGVEDFKRLVFIDSQLPTNPTPEDDGIYYVAEDGTLSIYVIDGGEVQSVASRIVSGDYIDDETFMSSGVQVALREGYLYVDGNSWYYYDGSRLTTLANANIYNSDGAIDDDRTVDVTGKTLKFQGDGYSVTIIDGVLTLEKDGNIGVFDISGLTDGRNWQLPDKSGIIALLDDLEELGGNEVISFDVVDDDIELKLTDNTTFTVSKTDLETLLSLSDYAKTDDIPEDVNELSDNDDLLGDKNVQSDLSETDEDSDSFVKNKGKLATKDKVDTDDIENEAVTPGKLDREYAEKDKVILKSEKGEDGGVAPLNSAGKIPSRHLPEQPSNVVIEDSYNDFPNTGEENTIYIDRSTGLQYVWDGNDYVQTSTNLSLGETSSTAYRGDRGKEAYEHSKEKGTNPHEVTKSDVGLSNVVNKEQLGKDETAADSNKLGGKGATEYSTKIWVENKGYLVEDDLPDPIDISGKEDTSNKATNLENPNDTKYPTTKAVSEAVEEVKNGVGKQDLQSVTEEGAETTVMTKFKGGVENTISGMGSTDHLIRGHTRAMLKGDTFENVLLSLPIGTRLFVYDLSDISNIDEISDDSTITKTSDIFEIDSFYITKEYLGDRTHHIGGLMYGYGNNNIYRWIYDRNGQTTSEKIKVDKITLDSDLGDLSEKDKIKFPDDTTNPDYYVKRSEIGENGGVAPIGSNGKVPAGYLPDMPNSVVTGTYVNPTTFKDAQDNTVTPQDNTIYVDATSGLQYAWSGAEYVQTSSNLSLGETSTTAYRGDRGKTAYEHSQVDSGNPHNVKISEIDDAGDLASKDKVAWDSDIENAPDIPEKTSDLTNDGDGNKPFLTEDDIPEKANNSKIKITSKSENVGEFDLNQENDKTLKLFEQEWPDIVGELNDLDLKCGGTANPGGGSGSIIITSTSYDFLDWRGIWDGKYEENTKINNSGETETSNDYFTSDFIPVTPGQPIKYFGSIDDDSIAIAGYSSENEGSYVTPILSNDTEDVKGITITGDYKSYQGVEIEVPENVNYLKISYKVTGNQSNSPNVSSMSRLNLMTPKEFTKGNISRNRLEEEHYNKFKIDLGTPYSLPVKRPSITFVETGVDFQLVGGSKQGGAYHKGKVYMGYDNQGVGTIRIYDYETGDTIATKEFSEFDHPNVVNFRREDETLWVAEGNDLIVIDTEGDELEYNRTINIEEVAGIEGKPQPYTDHERDWIWVLVPNSSNTSNNPEDYYILFALDPKTDTLIEGTKKVVIESNDSRYFQDGFYSNNRIFSIKGLSSDTSLSVIDVMSGEVEMETPLILEDLPYRPGAGRLEFEAIDLIDDQEALKIFYTHNADKHFFEIYL